MRLKLLSLITLILVLFAPTLALGENHLGQIAVSGQGHVKVEPDMARITVGVTKQARTASQAVDLMAADLSLVVTSLLESGLNEANIQTSQLRVNPEHSYDNSTGTSKLVGYVASSTVTVRIDDLSTLPSVLDGVLSNGANQMNGLQFDVADRNVHLDAARRLAVSDAMSKARVFADAADVTLGSLISLTEGGTARGPIMMADMAMARSESVPVMAGEITIEAQVSVVYQLGE